MATRKKKTPRSPPISRDPVTFWRAQYVQAKADAEKARTDNLTVLPRLLSLQREAWRELKAALAVVEPPASKAADEADDNSLEAQLAVARRMRRSAEAAGSFVAASKLLESEGVIAEAIRKRDEAAAKAARRGMNEDDFLSTLVAKLNAMPLAMQDRIKASLGW